MNDFYKLSFNFKGGRNYVQGPDIFDAVVDRIKSKFDIKGIRDIRYAAHNMLHTNADLFFTEEFNLNNSSKFNSIVTFKINDKKMFAVVIENQENILIFKEYSEDVVRSKSIIDKDTITFKNVLDDSLSEITVSMNKFYLQEAVTKAGKWIVTKFEYNNLVEIEDIKGKNLNLQLTNNFNNKLTKSTIRVDNKLVGFMYFSLI